MPRALGQSELVEQLIGTLSRPAPGAWTELVDDEQVLARGQKRNEIDGLEDEPDGVAAKLGELLGAVAGDVAAADDDGAGGRREQTAGDRAERRLARTGRPDEREDLVGADGEIDAVERGDLVLTAAVELAHTLHL